MRCATPIRVMPNKCANSANLCSRITKCSDSCAQMCTFVCRNHKNVRILVPTYACIPISLGGQGNNRVGQQDNRVGQQDNRVDRDDMECRPIVGKKWLQCVAVCWCLCEGNTVLSVLQFIAVYSHVLHQCIASVYFISV